MWQIGGIAVASPPCLYSPGGSIGPTVWLQFVTAGGSSPKSPLSLKDQGPPSNKMCHWTPQVYLPNGV